MVSISNLKILAKEKMIGWYHSGPKLKSSDLEINEMFKKYTSNPVLVIINVQPTDLGIPTDAYYSVEEIHDVSFLNISLGWNC
jgi:26S proteasome regulatory subunit N8